MAGAGRCSASPASAGYCRSVPPRHAKIHLHREPCNHLAANNKWPEGRLRSSPPGEAKLVRAITIRLKAATKGKTLSEIAEETGISISTLSKIRRGEAWPTVATIAHLERMLRTRLWGDEHFIPPAPP